MRAEFTALPEYAQALADPTKLPAGYDFDDAGVWSLDLLKDHMFLVTGTRQSGKSVFMEGLMLTCAERGDEVVVVDLGAQQRFAQIAAEHDWKQYTDGEGVLELFTRLNEEIGRNGPRGKIKLACKERRAPVEELFQESLAERRLDLFIGDMASFLDALYDEGSPAHRCLDLFQALCEWGLGYNSFFFGEMSDRDEPRLRSWACFETMAAARSGIRFGGRLNEQKVFPFENVRYQDQDRSLRPGVGLIPTDRREDRLIRVVVPMP